MRRPSANTVVTVAVLGGILAFLFWQLHAPSLLFLNTLTSGGDTGAHVALPAYMRDHLLTHGRITGWDPQWYDGFPVFTFYFPLPSLLVVVLNVAIPYDVAFKLVTVAGIFALPVAVWAFGRLSRMREPGPLCLAAATLPYLFDRSFTIYGGNIASTLAGEYAFSLSLAVGIVFLGVLARALREGRGAGLAAVLLALTGLSHLLPTLFVLAGAVVLLLMNWGWRQIRVAAPVVVVGGLLAGFWWIPFLLRLPYTTDMGWTKITDYLGDQGLFPQGNWWVFGLAVVGTGLAWGFRHRVGMFLSIMAAVAAAGFWLAPQGKIWNARFLPFWVLCLYLLAGVAVAEGGRLLVIGVSRLTDLPTRGGALTVPVAAVAAALGFSTVPLVNLPSWIPLHPTASFVPDWVKWNYKGYEQKASYPEYRALIDTMAQVGRRYGCGRAMWEYESELNRLGTPMALMLLPYWTNDCIDSMEGLLFESASSTPYHFLNQAELSERPSDAMLGLPYTGPDITTGIAHLQMLGVRYYMTFSPALQGQAAHDPVLKLVATSGPWPVQYSTGTVQRTWYIYEVAGSEMVAPLQYEPAVVTSDVSKAKTWLDMSVAWYQDPARWPVPLAASGPPSWPRVRAGDASPPRVPVAPVAATHVTVGDDRISFDVNRTGSPVVVRTSYFPNWQASGAEGPWRLTPNLMVVVPTSHHVSLHYGWTPVDWLGWLATGLGLAGVAALAWLHPWLAPAPDEAGGWPSDRSHTEGELPEGAAPEGVGQAEPGDGGADGGGPAEEEPGPDDPDGPDRPDRIAPGPLEPVP